MPQLWQGRASKAVDSRVNDFNSSIRFDARMIEQDIQGSLVHSAMLGRQGIISRQDVDDIHKGLHSILDDLHSGALEIDPNAEDVHTFVEQTLTARVGDAGKRLHTGRSRNDQVALDIRLNLRAASEHIQGQIKELITVLCDQAEKGAGYVMPGYTDDAGYCITAVGLGEMQVALAKCQNWDIDTCMYATNTISCGTVRGFGGQELKSAMMPVIDHMLADMNIDPVQFFHDNFVHAGDRYMWRDCNWWTCHEVDYRQAILEAAEKFGWKEKFKGWYKPTAVNGSKRIGVGVSIHGNGDVGEDNSEAIVRLHTNGSVILNQSLVESGQGQRAACAKMVAEVLNVPFESVTVTNTGTVDNPVEFGLCGSRGTLTSGTAATRAAEDALRQLQAMAAAVFRCSPTEIETCDGFVWVSNKPDNKLPWAAIIPYSTSITGFGRWKANYAQPNMCINFVEMEVDVETGEAKLLRELIGTDVGQIIDPKACEMQLQASIGSAMVDTGTFEETIYDYYTGRIMTNNLIDYKWRPFNEFPPIDLVIKESQPNISRFKAIGVGEISGSAGAAAIAMAIGNAIGKPYMKYPATPVNVLQALKEG